MRTSMYGMAAGIFLLAFGCKPRRASDLKQAPVAEAIASQSPSACLRRLGQVAVDFYAETYLERMRAPKLTGLVLGSENNPDNVFSDGEDDSSQHEFFWLVVATQERKVVLVRDEKLFLLNIAEVPRSNRIEWRTRFRIELAGTLFVGQRALDLLLYERDGGTFELTPYVEAGDRQFTRNPTPKIVLTERPNTDTEAKAIVQRAIDPTLAFLGMRKFADRVNRSAGPLEEREINVCAPWVSNGVIERTLVAANQSVPTAAELVARRQQFIDEQWPSLRVPEQDAFGVRVFADPYGRVPGRASYVYRYSLPRREGSDETRGINVYVQEDFFEVMKERGWRGRGLRIVRDSDLPPLEFSEGALDIHLTNLNFANACRPYPWPAGLGDSFICVGGGVVNQRIDLGSGRSYYEQGRPDSRIE